MRRGVETLGIAYVVLASLYGGAMYFSANKTVGHDLTNAPVYAYEAARETFPEADNGLPMRRSVSMNNMQRPSLIYVDPHG